LESMLEVLEELILRRCWLIAKTREFEESGIDSGEFYEKWSEGL